MGTRYWMPKKPMLKDQESKKSNLADLTDGGSVVGKNKSFSCNTYLPNFDEMWCQELPKSERKLLFIDIPKTGSTSIKRSVLANSNRFLVGRKELGENGFKLPTAPGGVEVKGYLDSFQKNRCKWKRNCSNQPAHIVPFTIVRNPYTWFRSFYTHGRLDSHALFNRTDFSFKEAVMAWCDPDIESKKLAGGALYKFGAPKKENIKICDWYRWNFCNHIFSNDGQCFIKIIIRFERIKKAYDILCEQLDVKKETLPHLMEAPCNTFDDQYLWDAEMIETFGNFYKKELKSLRYNFKGSIDNSVFVNTDLIK